MNRNLLLMMGATAALAVATAQACTVETVDGTGGGLTTSTTSSSQGGATTTTTSTGGTAGVGGSGTGGSIECISCAEYITEAAAGNDPDVETVCDDPAGTDDSFGLLEALGECTCGASECADLCEFTCEGTGTDAEGSDATDDCAACQTASSMNGCSTEFGACANDV